MESMDLYGDRLTLEDIEREAVDEGAAVVAPLEHHSVLVVWEEWVAPGVWRPLAAVEPV